MISTWVLKGMEQARGAILQCPQAKERKRKAYPWSGVHAPTGDRLHLAERADRKKILALCQEGKQILCATVERSGVIAQ